MFCLFVYVYMYFSVMFTILCRNLDSFSLEIASFRNFCDEVGVCHLYYLFCLSSAVEFTIQLVASIQWLEIVLYEA